MKNNLHYFSCIVRFSQIIFTILILLFAAKSVYAQNLAIDFQREHHGLVVQRSSTDGLEFSVTYPGIRVFRVITREGEFDEIGIPGAYSIGEVGTPKLPATKKLIEVPHGAEIRVWIKSFTTAEYRLRDYGIDRYLMPVQPSVRKDQNPDDLPFEYDRKLYQTDRLISHEPITVEILGVLRGMRLARLTIAPVSYNPVQGIIRVMNDIVAEVSFINVDHQLNQYIKSATYSPYFEPLQQAVLNPLNQGYPAHPDLTKYPVKYLIVSPRMFENDLQPFIQWKTKKGFKVITGYTDQIGTTYSAIQSWVHAQYNAGTPTDPAPSFLLIVGDTPQIPAITGSSSGKMTDLYYASVDGDYFPEMYYGRFSATNSAQLVSQIAKTLYYERYEFADPSYLNGVTLIAGADAVWNPRVGQPTVLYGTNNYFNAAMGYTNVYAYLTSPYTGCYDPTRIAVSMINYTAHCNETSWGDPLLTQSAVNAFVNNGKYPVAIGNCCLAADFGYSECIGETWQRAVNKGSVAYIGSSPSSYWFEDFYWAVGAFPIQGTNNGYVPTYNETTWGAYDAPFVSNYVTTGATVFVGNLAVTEVHIQGYPSHSSPLYYWQAYNVLGDPSLIPYHRQGTANSVTHMPIFPIGITSYEVAAQPGSYVAISKDGILHGTALVGPSGMAEVQIIPVTSAGMVDIVVTKPQRIPYMVQVPAAVLQGPYITLDSFTINDQNGNNNGLADYGETINLHVTLKNIGSSPSGSVNCTISGNDPYVSISGQPFQNFGVINGGSTQTVLNAYQLVIAGFVPNQHQAVFQLQITDGTNNWTSTLKITVFAPQLSSGSMTINDTQGGNGNNRLDAGESAFLTIPVTNSGGSATLPGQAVLTSTSTWIQVVNGSQNLPVINPGMTQTMVFQVSVHPDTPSGTLVSFNFQATSGPYNTQNTYHTIVGLIIEDFESGNFSRFPWSFGGNAPWTLDPVSPYEGTWSARSGTITHGQKSEMSLTFEVLAPGNISFARKVSSETNYDFLVFYIDNVQIAKWSGNLSWSEVSFPVSPGVRTFKWSYEKDNSVNSGSDCAWVDKIIFPALNTAPMLNIQTLTVNDSQGGNGNGRLDPGETAQITINCINNGLSIATNVTGTVVSLSPQVNISTTSFNLGSMLPGTPKPINFQITVSPFAQLVIADINVLLTSGTLSAQKTFNLPVGNYYQTETFNRGNFNTFNWQFSGNASWVISTEQPYEGSYCAKSGLITHNQTTSMFLTINTNFGGEVSFWYKVSSEANYDFLRFYINDVEQNRWSGSVSWQKATYQIPSGTFTLRWSYTKDGSINSGSDCAWVDFISWPGMINPGPLQVAIMAHPLQINTGETVSFYDISAGLPQQWQWTFEGGNPPSSTLKNPKVTYLQPGIFDVSLTVSNSSGQITGVFNDYITVLPPLTQQMFNLPAGWSGLSSYLTPQNTDLSALLQPVLNHLIIVQSLDGIYFPAMGINTIGPWNTQKGYKIKMQQDAALSFQGWPVLQGSVTLNPGWNLIPVLSQCNQGVSSIFSNMNEPGFLVKEVAGTGIWWPFMGINTLNGLQPGKAYFVRVDTLTTILFPPCSP